MTCESVEFLFPAEKKQGFCDLVPIGCYFTTHQSPKSTFHNNIYLRVWCEDSGFVRFVSVKSGLTWTYPKSGVDKAVSGFAPVIVNITARKA